ncbi:hypothetical protein C2S51_025024 [Perilla frutescens var. frutescens]|nr:hypothetical protein C2S51_025024 [Perilla frutescens var. frutescens]
MGEGMKFEKEEQRIFGRKKIVPIIRNLRKTPALIIQVKESSNAQLSRLEELKRRLEALNPSKSSTYISSENQRLGTTQDSPAVPTISERVGNITDGSAINSSMKDQNQPPFVEAQGRGKKKKTIHGKLRGIRGPAAAGWSVGQVLVLMSTAEVEYG